jgi:hypothetical protein
MHSAPPLVEYDRRSVDLARKFSRENIVPVAAQYDRSMVSSSAKHAECRRLPILSNTRGQ